MKKKLAIIASIIFLNLSFSSSASSQGIWESDSTNGFFGDAYHTSCVLNNKIYVIPGDYVTVLQVFDPMTHLWNTPSTTGEFRTNQHYLATSAALNGKIYLIGGSDGGNVSTNTNHIYDPTTQVWSVLNATGKFTPRYGLTASVVNDKIYVMGGDSSSVLNAAFATSNILEVFDPSTNSWTTPSTIGTFTPRSELTSCIVDGKIYVIGGVDKSSKMLNTLEVFDPSTNIWSTPTTTGTFTARHMIVSGVVNGKIYVLGGSTADHIAPCNIVEMFDPLTNTWNTPVTTGKFSPRFALSSGVVNGKIYALAGYNPHNDLNTNEVFTPAAADVKTEQASNIISLSPNPTTGIITVQNAPSNILHITVSNILGESVIELLHPNSSDITFDISKLPAGTYFVRFSLAGSVITRKIVKE